MTTCLEVLNNGTSRFDCLSKDSLKLPRHGHAICCLNDKFLIVTGSRLEKDGACRSVESYNIDVDLWFDMPMLNQGRYYHSSCGFNDQWVYVFCGISISSKKYFNSIERLDTKAVGSNKVWQEMQLTNDSPNFTVRQGCGSSQINNNEILVFGGFGGEFLKDCHLVRHSDFKLSKFPREPPMKIFAFQMPTLYDLQSGNMLTADWQSKRVLRFDNQQKWYVVKDLNQVQQ